jgi:hypothetical protein
MWEPARKFINGILETMNYEVFMIEKMHHREAGLFYGLLTLVVLSSFLLCFALKVQRDENAEIEYYKREAKKYE